MESELKKAIEVLQKGGLILYPTDTVWGIGCDASNNEAVERIYDLKKRDINKPLISFVADERMLKKYVATIPPVAISIIEISDSPTTIIYDKGKNLAPHLINKNNTVAIRVPNDDFCYWLCRRFNGAIVSTSANLSGETTPKSFKEIAPEVLKGVDYVVNLQREKICSKPSSTIKLSNNGVVKIIRK